MATAVAPVDFQQLLQQVHGGVLPSEVKILVHLSEVETNQSPGACTAMCLQYPVHAKAESPEAAVTKLLDNLVGYLSVCAEQKCFAPSWADQVYTIAFDYGADMNLPDIDAHISEALQRHLGTAKGTSIESLLQLRDIRKMQIGADERSIEELFGQAA